MPEPPVYCLLSTVSCLLSTVYCLPTEKTLSMCKKSGIRCRIPLFFLNLQAVHPPLNNDFRALPLQVARARRPRGTRRTSLSAASVRTWHGSRVYVAQDPAVSTPYRGRTPQAKPGGGSSTPLQRFAGI